MAPDVDELTEGDPEVAVLENARRKARAGLELARGEGIVPGGRHRCRPRRPPAREAGGRGCGARASRGCSPGTTHEVLSGLVLLGTGAGTEVPVEKSGIARTAVTFRDLDEPVIDLYVASGEWRDRAGGYAIQGLGLDPGRRLAGRFLERRRASGGVVAATGAKPDRFAEKP